MEKLKFNPNNAKYYSEEFIKGFECGVERQYEKDKAEINHIVRGKWIAKNFHTFTCSNCKGFDLDIMKVYHIEKYLHCPFCGAEMKEVEE